MQGTMFTRSSAGRCLRRNLLALHRRRATMTMTQGRHGLRSYAAPAAAASWSTSLAPAPSSKVMGTRELSSAAAEGFQNEAGEKLFDKILIANRGEISCRVIRSAQKLGIKTVAIYSEPDVHALHVRLADESVCVGPAASGESYLNIPAILDAIEKTGAQAVHPGYGFLSENHHFAEELEKKGVSFIGPNTRAITAMGDKIESKQLARDANVNTIPGFLGLVNTNDEVKKIANEIGYPVMLKASAGGGGKGMRIAWNDEEAIMGYRLSKQEAQSSFGDDRIFIEKYIEEPRHIEIQVLADKHGNVVAFPERECSIQRRNQKVIEESPSMLLDKETRKAMGEQACQLAKAVDYVSAGTVEFLCDKHKNFFFLEMNTRLQVEHPITEYVSGVDLVHQMLRIAAGHPLPQSLIDAWNTPEGMPIKGWAIESRVYAEDPLRNFLPSIGRLDRYVEPSLTHVVPQDKSEEDVLAEAQDDPSGHGFGGVRIDAGVSEGNEISMFYDPMICKLVTHGKDRPEALQKMRDALDSYTIRGVGHNVEFLRDIMDSQRFIDGKLTTNFIPEEYPDGFQGRKLDPEHRAHMAASAALMHVIRQSRQYATTGQAHERGADTSGDGAFGFDGVGGTYGVHPLCVSLSPEPGMKAATDSETASSDKRRTWYATSVDWDQYGRDAIVSVVPPPAEGASEEEAAREAVYFALSDVDWTSEDPLMKAHLGKVDVNEQGDGSDEIPVHDSLKLLMQHNKRLPEGFSLGYRGALRDCAVRTPRQQELCKFMLHKPGIDYSKVLVSPMPGSLISLAVEEGEEVEAGQEVAIVEAMKMQNVLRAEKKAKVKSVKANPGDTLSVDQTIVEFE
eukprot:gb/GECG01012503.1/.p1 GENE.gb/GECG01012503.1/~~gb/GECG01012503.1/.p1  ORF type:complete len:849 (+),score=120.11 gb/GECG01012503.1/:1-2547(+)